MNSEVDNLADQLRPGVMTLRIIVCAMAGGVLMYAGVAVSTRMAEPGGRVAGALDVVTLLAFVLTPLAFGGWWLIPGALAKRARRAIGAGTFAAPRGANGSGPTDPAGDADKLFSVYQTNTILGAALLEAVAFFDVTACLLQGSWFALGLAVLPVMGILTMFPSAPRAAEWIAEQMRLIAEEKLLVN